MQNTFNPQIADFEDYVLYMRANKKQNPHVCKDFDELREMYYDKLEENCVDFIDYDEYNTPEFISGVIKTQYAKAGYEEMINYIENN